MTVQVLLLGDEVLGVYTSRHAAELGVERYRDECEYPPDLDEFIIIEREVLTESG